MYDLGVSCTFHFHKKNTESSVIFLQNDALILNGKENKEATAICFEISIPKKKKKELLRKIQSKIYEVISLWKKTKKKIGLLIFPNIITEQWGYCLRKQKKLKTNCRFKKFWTPFRAIRRTGRCGELVLGRRQRVT